MTTSESQSAEIEEVERGASRRGSAANALDALRSSARASTAHEGVVSLRTRLLELRVACAQPTGRLVVLALVVLLLSLGGAVLLVRSRGNPVSTAPAAVEPTGSSMITTTTTVGTIIAVAGAVRSPGVYRLGLGARVVDALEAAGGPADDIDLDRVNLAAPVTDGERVWFARNNESVPAVASGDIPGTGASSGNSSQPLDLNTATLDQLDSLSGIGPATAKSILERRNQMGRFRSVDDLLTVKGIGASKLEALRNEVVVR